MKMRWQTIESNVSIRTINPTATPVPRAYDCVAVYIAGRRTHLVLWSSISDYDVNKNEHIFRVTVPLKGESTDHRWIPLTTGE